MTKLLYSFGIIFFGLSLGVAIQALHRNGRLRLPLPIVEMWLCFRFCCWCSSRYEFGM